MGISNSYSNVPQDSIMKSQVTVDDTVGGTVLTINNVSGVIGVGRSGDAFLTNNGANTVYLGFGDTLTLSTTVRSAELAAGDTMYVPATLAHAGIKGICAAGLTTTVIATQSTML